MNARSIRLGIASLALVGVCGASVTSLASSALFTDSISTGASTVASGSVDLTLGGTASTTLAVAAMAPGDSRFGVVTVQNSGSLGLRYAGEAGWSSGNALTSILQVSARTLSSAASTCDSTLGWGSGDVVTNQVATDNTTSLPLFGSPNTGAQPGDRLLSAASAEHFCVRLTLPSTAGNNVANLTSDLSLAFAAEQTANNP